MGIRACLRNQEKRGLNIHLAESTLFFLLVVNSSWVWCFTTYMILYSFCC